MTFKSATFGPKPTPAEAIRKFSEAQAAYENARWAVEEAARLLLWALPENTPEAEAAFGLQQFYRSAADAGGSDRVANTNVIFQFANKHQLWKK